LKHTKRSNDAHQDSGSIQFFQFTQHLLRFRIVKITPASQLPGGEEAGFAFP